MASFIYGGKRPREEKAMGETAMGETVCGGIRPSMGEKSRGESDMGGKVLLHPKITWI